MRIGRELKTHGLARRKRGPSPPLEALALDFDGTLTMDGGHPSEELLKSLRALNQGSITLVLATGRCVGDVFERVGRDLFDGVVAENGAVIVVHGRSTYAAPPGWKRVRGSLLRKFEPGCEKVIISAPRSMLSVARNSVSPKEAHIELNKDRLMIVPLGVDKGSGLATALSKLGVAENRTACIGDGENDLSMFDVVRVRAALGNSVPSLKRRADFVADGNDGAGTMEAIEWLFDGKRGLTTGKEAGV